MVDEQQVAPAPDGLHDRALARIHRRRDSAYHPAVLDLQAVQRSSSVRHFGHPEIPVQVPGEFGRRDAGHG